MCLCGVGHIGLRLLSWKDGFSLIPGAQRGRLRLDIGQRGTGCQIMGSLMNREEPVPSFMLMDLQGMSLVLYIYTLENGQIKVEKVYHFFNARTNWDSCHIERGRHDNMSGQ